MVRDQGPRTIKSQCQDLNLVPLIPKTHFLNNYALATLLLYVCSKSFSPTLI